MQYVHENVSPPFCKPMESHIPNLSQAFHIRNSRITSDSSHPCLPKSSQAANSVSFIWISLKFFPYSSFLLPLSPAFLPSFQKSFIVSNFGDLKTKYTITDLKKIIIHWGNRRINSYNTVCNRCQRYVTEAGYSGGVLNPAWGCQDRIPRGEDIRSNIDGQMEVRQKIRDGEGLPGKECSQGTVAHSVNKKEFRVAGTWCVARMRLES